MPDPEFILLGDAVWLDFVNTARGRSPNPPDRLTGPPAWHAWLDALQLPPGTASFDEARALLQQFFRKKRGSPGDS